MNPSWAGLQWDERASAPGALLRHTDAVIASLFERCADAIWLHDPRTVNLADRNQGAVELIGAAAKQQLLRPWPEDLAPPFQPDGFRSADRTPEIVERLCFEWTIRRRDGRDVPTEEKFG